MAKRGQGGVRGGLHNVAVEGGRGGDEVSDRGMVKAGVGSGQGWSQGAK